MRKKKSFTPWMFLLLALTGNALWSCQSEPTELHEVYDESGNLLERYHRRKSDYAKEGEYRQYYPDGTLMEIAQYENDSLQGLRVRFHPNGDTASVSMMKGGRFEGPHIEYYAKGNIVEQRYMHVDGAINGILRGYYPDGSLKEEVSYKDNLADGPFTEYHPNGNKKTEGTYVAGREMGALREYDEQGRLVRKADCANKEVAGQIVTICTTTWSLEEE